MLEIFKKTPFIIFTAICSISYFAFLFVEKQNYEFIIYIGVIIFFFFLVLSTIRYIHYPPSSLWGLSLWATLHMAGGGVYLGETRLYDLMLLPLSDRFPVFRYDQFVHMIGFAVATYAMYFVLKPMLRSDLIRFKGLCFILVTVGMGLGALNEVVEFLVDTITPQSGVGGYLNTSLDLVANLIGSVLAMGWIRFYEIPRTFKASRY